MFRVWKIFLCVLLMLGGGPLRAATSAEKRAFNVAAKGFRLDSWAYAETNFDQFVSRYPDSDLVPEAVLLQAQSAYHQGKHEQVLSLLSARRDRAGGWGDLYCYWLGQSYLASGKYEAAGGAFAEVSEKFPASTNRFSASVGEAEARARLQQWPQVIRLLQTAEGAFQQGIRAGAGGLAAAAGYLILGEAQLAQKDFAAADESLRWLAAQELNPVFAWRRSYLKCRVRIGEGSVDLPSADELVAAAAATKDAAFLSKSITLQADVLERLGRFDEAIAAHKRNLAAEMPEAGQDLSRLKIAELSLKLNKPGDSAVMLEQFLRQHTNSAVTDAALLSLGELRLKEFAANPQATNRLFEAEACFQQLLGGFAASPTAPRASLGLGWCQWLRGAYADSAVAFQAAAINLPFSEDQAVARFKWADARFLLKDYAGALSNYTFVIEHFAELPKAKAELIEPALYQQLRAALEAGEVSAATNALGNILAWYPDGFAGDRALLLTGQGFSHQQNPAGARVLFSRFQELYPDSPLAVEVRLALARSFEREGNWTAAITNYDAWLAGFTNHPGRAAAEFSRAWNYFRAGEETNAFALFNQFLVQNPTDPLRLQAQWWIADYYFRQGKFLEAEASYQLVFKGTNWPASDLTCQAKMMAGRAALARFSYTAATNYFSDLAVNTNCPLDLRFQATFACGDVLMSRTDTEVTNRQADLKEAIEWFSSIAQKYPTNALAPAAWGRIGDCYKDLAAYATNHYAELATAAYQNVLDLPQASVAERSQAQVGLGIMAEKQAGRTSSEAQTASLRAALEHYLDVFLGRDLRTGEQPDLYWVREAGLNAYRVAADELNDWPQALNICTNLVREFPQLRAAFETKLQRAREQAARGK